MTGNIFNISSNFHFLDSLFNWICDNFKEDLQDLTIIFPNKRASREFSLKFQEVSKNTTKIKSIFDINIDDFYYFFEDKNLHSQIEEIKSLKNIDNLNYLFFLTNEILETKIFKNINFSGAFGLAIKIKNLFEEIKRNEINIEKIEEIDDSNLSKHLQFSLDFLKDFYIKINNKVAKNNIVSEVNFQDFIVKKFSFLMNEFGTKRKIIIAGSTGSSNLSKELIKSIQNQENGFVFLYGLDKNYQEIEDEKSCQFILHNLLKYLEINIENIKEIEYEKYKICDEKRIDFVRKSLISSQKTFIWNNCEIDKNFLQNDFTKNILYFEASNQIEEAKIIVNNILQNYENVNKIAIISQSNLFLEIIKSELQKNNLEFNNSNILDFKEFELLNFILLLASCVENNFQSYYLLAILKHKYLNYKSEILAKFEIEILRKQRPENSIKSILEAVNYVDEDVKNLFLDFYYKIENLEKKYFNFSDFFNEILNSVEKLLQKNITQFLENFDYKDDIINLFNKIKSINNPKIDRKEFRELLSKIFSSFSYFEKTNATAKIQILSPIEARLLNFDLLIIPDLNYGNFPQIEADNWLGKKIHKDLEIDFSAKIFGQISYHFCNYFASKKVILTRSKYENSLLNRPSIFISRLEILAKKNEINLKNNNIFEKIDIKKEKKNVEFAKVSLENRPKTIAASDVEKLVLDPYQFYAKKILQLKKLDEIDYKPSNREFGNAVHKILEHYVKDKNFEKVNEIFNKFFINKESKIIYFIKLENVINNFLDKNKDFEEFQNYAEISANILIENILINARIDRISIKENEVLIFDYKTGNVASKKEVLNGTYPQLLLYLLMLEDGNISQEKLQNIKISSLNYWKLSQFEENIITNITQKIDISELKNIFKNQLEKLLKYYNDENNFYKISKNQENINDYFHLERL